MQYMVCFFISASCQNQNCKSKAKHIGALSCQTASKSLFKRVAMNVE